MATIKASCPTCGEVELTPADVTLKLCTSRPDLSTYAFECSGCHSEISKPACDHVITLLVSGGVTAETWDVPHEVLEEHTGPPLTLDDLIDLGLNLAELDR